MEITVCALPLTIVSVCNYVFEGQLTMECVECVEYQFVGQRVERFLLWWVVLSQFICNSWAVAWHKKYKHVTHLPLILKF